MGEVKQKVMRDIKVLPTYVKIGKDEYPAGKAIVDPYSGEVLRHVSNKFNLITNQELIELLADYYNISNKEYFSNEPGDSFLIRGIFKDKYIVNEYNEVMYYAYDILNSYSLRYPPTFYLNIYVQGVGYILTNIQFAEIKRKEKELIIEDSLQLDNLHSLMDTDLTEVDALQLLSRLSIPKRINWKEIYQRSRYRKGTLYNFLMVLSKIYNEWQVSGFELATNKIRNIYPQ